MEESIVIVPESLPELLLYLQRKFGQSTRDLGKKLGVNHTTVNGWIRGTTIRPRNKLRCAINLIKELHKETVPDSNKLTIEEEAKIYAAFRCPLIYFSDTGRILTGNIVNPWRIEKIDYLNEKSSNFFSTASKIMTKANHHNLNWFLEQWGLSRREYDWLIGNDDSRKIDGIDIDIDVVKIVEILLELQGTNNVEEQRQLFIHAGCIIFETLVSNIRQQKETPIDKPLIDTEKPTQFVINTDTTKPSTSLKVDTSMYRGVHLVWNSTVELEAHLDNILNHKGYLGMLPDWKQRINPNWSVTDGYFMDSALFFFAQYLASTQILIRDLHTHKFRMQQDYKEFFEAMRLVEKSLDGFPPDYLIPNERCEGGDSQVFLMQQRTIGEFMLINENNLTRCMSFTEFKNRLEEPRIKHALEPLIALLTNLSSKQECRWKRIESTFMRIKRLREISEHMLSKAE